MESHDDPSVAFLCSGSNLSALHKLRGIVVLHVFYGKN